MANSALGFDPSLTSSGYSYRSSGGGVVAGVIKTDKLRGVDRLLYIQNTFEDLLYESEPSLVTYEGYSMGSKGRQYDIGELGGVLKMFAFMNDVPILLIPPTVLKKFITGKGNASKEEVVLKLYKRFGYEAPQTDEADAIALMLFGEEYLAGGGVVADLTSKCQILNPRKRRKRLQRISA